MRFRASFAPALALCSLTLGCDADGTDDPPRNVSPGTGGTSASAGAGGVGGSAAGLGGGIGQAGGAGGVAGQAGAGGAAGGAGGNASVSAPVTPAEAGGKYTFSYGDVAFVVDASFGGRIISFKKGAVEFMDAGDGANNYGSTFWPSPQTAWNWPPPAEIDSAAYTATLEGSTLVLTGTTNAALQLSASKRFTVDSGLDRVEIVYSLTNASAAQTSVAPWEVTRVDAGGLTFYPAPSEGTTPTAFPHDYDATAKVTWFDYAAEGPGEGKLFQDGSGWLAHVQQGALFIKTFPDIPSSAAASGETEIELYTNGSSYVEIENQGAYAALAPGASLTYTVYWYARPLPETVQVAARSTSLYDFARAIAEQ